LIFDLIIFITIAKNKPSKMKNFTLICLFVVGTTVLRAQGHITYKEMKNFTQGSLEVKEFSSYLASDNHVYKVGDTIKLGRPSSEKTFTYLQEGSGVLFSADPADASASGTNTIIKSIYADGTKKSGYKIYFIGKGICALCPRYYIDADLALMSNEVVSLGMTKDKAIAKLKESKELLDLGIISKEEYEKIKTELTPVITAGNSGQN
jgi:hypothetical protein